MADLADFKSKMFQMLASLFEAASGWPGTWEKSFSLVKALVTLVDLLVSKIRPSGFIRFRAFQIKEAMDDETALVRLGSPAFHKYV